VAELDTAAVLDVARQYDIASGIIDGAVRSHLADLRFDGAVAGRMHAAHGDAVRLALDDVAHRLQQWSRAAAEIAAELRASAARYVDADARGARRIG
jgi:hypothetical protein